MKALIESLDNQKIFKINGENTYLVNTITDHVPSTTPLVLKQAVAAIIKKIGSDLVKANKIIGEEERGGYITACLSLKANLPFCLAKQNPCKIPGEVGVKFHMTYNDNMTMYLNGLSAKDKVIIIDDIVDSGGTMIAIINTLQKMNIEIVKAIVLVERIEKQGIRRIKEVTGIEAETIIKIDTSGEKSIVINKHELLDSQV